MPITRARRVVSAARWRMQEDKSTNLTSAYIMQGGCTNSLATKSSLGAITGTSTPLAARRQRNSIQCRFCLSAGEEVHTFNFQTIFCACSRRTNRVVYEQKHLHITGAAWSSKLFSVARLLRGRRTLEIKMVSCSEFCSAVAWSSGLSSWPLSGWRDSTRSFRAENSRRPL